MKKIAYIVALSFLFFTSCEKMQFDDPTTYTIEEAKLYVTDYYYKLATGNFQSVMFRANDGYYYGFGYGGLADQSTFTNRVNEWWDFAIEPRVPLNNARSYAGESHFYYPYYYFYLANMNANIILEALDGGESALDESGNDRTTEVRAMAHFIKGVAQGYLGSIFDRGIIADENLGAQGAREFSNSYKEMIENAASHFDRALTAANSLTSFNLSDYYVNMNLDKAGFVRLINSMAARLYASIPRDKEESEALGNAFWTRVLNYANGGFTTDFIAPYVSGGYYNYNVYYGLVEAGGGPYLPADIKIPYLADKTGTYPNSYPLDESVMLAPVETDDERFTRYFKYTQNFGYLRLDRGRNLFSNYKHNRWSQPGSYPNTTNVTGYPNPVFLAEEVRLLRAEAKMWLGDIAGAAAELNDPAADRIAIGTLPSIASTEAAVRHTLHYEYSISIDLAGGCTNPWTFMRRNNLLQKGTPTEFPIPERQLLFTSESVYSFGGAANAGAKGKWGETTAASGVGAWKD
jgi:hypothetical protein